MGHQINFLDVPDERMANIEIVLRDGGKRILFHQPVSSDYLKVIIS